MPRLSDWYATELGEWWTKQVEKVNYEIETSDDPQMVRIRTKQRKALMAFLKEVEEEGKWQTLTWST